MKKMILLISAILVILAQSFVIAQFFVNRYSVIWGGDEFKFLLSDFDITNAHENGYIDINLKKEISGEGEYGILRIDENGFAELDKTAVERPSFGAYIKNGENGYFKFPFDKYYIKSLGKTYKKLVVTEDTKAYIVVAIKDGIAEVVDFLIDGVEVEKYIK